MPIILDGKMLSGIRALELQKKVGRLKTKPKLVIIQVGDLSASNTYIARKKAFAEKIGVIAIHKKYKDTVSEKILLADIARCNKDKTVNGVMVQLPLPAHLDRHTIVDSIVPTKDVDGLTSVNTKLLFDGLPTFMPATVKGILSLLEQYKFSLKGKKVVIVGRSTLVGRPMALACLQKDATVTICHTKTKNLAEETKRADILIVAAGHPKLISKKHVTKGQVIIDVGITVGKNGKIVGDVDFNAIKDIVRAISPVPGGVGPMTILSLFENVVSAC